MFYLNKKLFFALSCCCSLSINITYSQCCGSGSPIAGGILNEVSSKNQLEIASYIKYFYSNVTKRADSLSTMRIFEERRDLYQYSKIAYGLTENLTMSIELGYFHNRTAVLVGGSEISGKGISDLILFPRYRALKICKKKGTTSLTFGMGIKIPLGKHDQKYVVYENKKTGQKVEIIKGPSEQPTTGTTDFIFHGLLFHASSKYNGHAYLASTYFLRGTNHNKQSFGDIFKATLSFGTYLNPKILYGIIEFDYEQTQPLIDKVWISYEKNTGGKLVKVIPKLNFEIQPLHLSINTSYNVLLYQYVNGTQIGFKETLEVGISYRPVFKKKEKKEEL